MLQARFFYRLLRWRVMGIRRGFEKLFVVYPGGDSDYAAYLPRASARWLPFLVPMGQVGDDTLVLAVPYGAREMESNPQLLERLQVEVSALGRRDQMKAIALAGRLPGLMHRNDLPLEPPFVDGLMGTVYACTASLQAHIEASGRAPGDVRVGLLGVGFTGQRLVERWRALSFKEIVCVDTRDRSSAVAGPRVRFSRDLSALSDVDYLVVLVARGEQAEVIVPHLKRGCVVLDDTHPMMPAPLVAALKGRGIDCFKVVVEDGSRFHPRLPGFHERWLPGCMIEAIVVAENGGFRLSSQERFAQRARELGLRAVRCRHDDAL